MQLNRRTFATNALVLLVTGGLSACQRIYSFHVSGVVRANDGGPLSGVQVGLKARSIYNSPFPVNTGPDGKIDAQFQVLESEFYADRLPQWELELSKGGYETVRVDISPKQRPESSAETTLISVAETTLRVK